MNHRHIEIIQKLFCKSILRWMANLKTPSAHLWNYLSTSTIPPNLYLIKYSLMNQMINLFFSISIFLDSFLFHPIPLIDSITPAPSPLAWPAWSPIYFPWSILALQKEKLAIPCFCIMWANLPPLSLFMSTPSNSLVTCPASRPHSGRP
jgi:hypothetical protein